MPRKIGTASLIFLFLPVIFVFCINKAFAQIYKYTDEKGVVHYVDRREEIPKKFRGREANVLRIKKMNTAGGEKNPEAPENYRMIPGVDTGSKNRTSSEESKRKIEELRAQSRAEGAENEGVEEEKAKPVPSPVEDFLPRYYDITYAFSFQPPEGYHEISPENTGAQAYYVKNTDATGFISTLLVYAQPAPEAAIENPKEIMEAFKSAYITQWGSGEQGYSPADSRISQQSDSHFLLEVNFKSNLQGIGNDIAVLMYFTHSALITFQFRLPPNTVLKSGKMLEEVKNSFTNDGLSFSQGTLLSQKNEENNLFRILLAAIGFIVFAVLFGLALRSLREL